MVFRRLIAMDRVTKAKIESLKYALRDRAARGEDPDLAQLARKFQLDPLIVRRIAEEEGLQVPDDDEHDPPDPRSPTGIIDVSEMPWTEDADER